MEALANRYFKFSINEMKSNSVNKQCIKEDFDIMSNCLTRRAIRQFLFANRAPFANF